MPDRRSIVHQASGAEGISLDLDAYLSDFWSQFETLRRTMWKLERRQEFQEPGNPIWEEFVAGRVDVALRSAEQQLDELLAYHARLATKGAVSRRVRVVHRPISRYLWWECHVLRVRARAGEQIRVVDSAQVAARETSGEMLPELLVLDDRTMYEVQYDDTGAAIGAWRIGDRATIVHWRDYIEGLYQAGEEFGDYFQREIAPLPAP